MIEFEFNPTASPKKRINEQNRDAGVIQSITKGLYESSLWHRALAVQEDATPNFRETQIRPLDEAISMCVSVAPRGVGEKYVPFLGHGGMLTRQRHETREGELLAMFQVFWIAVLTSGSACQFGSGA